MESEAIRIGVRLRPLLAGEDGPRCLRVRRGPSDSTFPQAFLKVTDGFQTGFTVVSSGG